MPVSFEFRKRLGSGYFGEVWKVRDIGLNVVYALKCIPHDKIINQDNYFQEAQILKETEHPNVVKIYDTGILPDNRIYIAMEYLKGRSLEDEASGGFIHLSRAKKLMTDILRALDYSHSKGIVHRDIKPANILIGNASEGKLSDFGLALPVFSKLNLSLIKQHYQYFPHLAPEVNNFSDYTFLSDIYSCGVTLYRLVNGDSYFEELDVPTMRDLAQKGKFPDRTKYREFIPRPLRLIINKAMSVDPSKRYQSAEEMRRALEQVSIVLSWNENKLPNGFRWTCTCENGCFEIKRLKVAPGNYEVTVSKGASKHSLRKLRSLCGQQLSKKEAEILCKRNLQDLVMGK